MSQWTPKQLEINERLWRTRNWSAEKRMEHYQKHKEFYDKLSAEKEANEDYQKWRSMLCVQSSLPPSSKLECEEVEREELREKEDDEGNASSIGNS